MASTFTKFPNEQVPFGIDWSALLPGNVGAATWGVPVGLVNVSEYKQGDVTFIVLGDGDASTTYEVTCSVVPADDPLADPLIRSMFIQVQAEPVWATAPGLTTIYGTVELPTGAQLIELADRRVEWGPVTPNTPADVLPHSTYADIDGRWSIQVKAGSVIEVNELGAGVRRRVVAPTLPGGAVALAVSPRLDGRASIDRAERV